MQSDDMSNYNDAMNMAARYCSLAEHCKQDVLSKLNKFELTESEIQQLVDWLIREGYINESRYTNAFVKDKFRFARWGKVKIRQSLREKRIPSALIEDALSLIDEEEYCNCLKELLEQKSRSTKARNTYEKRSKLVRFAAGRGFEPSLAINCLSKMGLSDEETGDFC